MREVRVSHLHVPIVESYWVRRTESYGCLIRSGDDIIEDDCEALHLCVCASSSVQKSLRATVTNRQLGGEDYAYTYDDYIDDDYEQSGGDMTGNVVGSVIILVSVGTVLFGCCIMYRRYKSTQIFDTSDASTIYAQAQVPHCPHGVYLEQMPQNEEVVVSDSCTITDCVAVPAVQHTELQDMNGSGNTPQLSVA